MTNPKFSVSNVSVHPPDGSAGEYILKELTFEIFPGEIFTILGPSGAGKSTLLRLLNALDEPDEGEILFEERPVSDMDIFELRSRVGMVFQQPALFPGTVEENLNFPRGKIDNSQRITEPNQQLLTTVGLDPSLLNRDASSLSVGQQQRVMIARALVNRPDVLLLDEPTSALDPSATKRILELIRHLQDTQGLTLVYVTHNIPEAREIAERVLLLIDGSIQGLARADSFFAGETGELARRFLAGELNIQ